MSEVDVERAAKVTGEDREDVIRKGLESYISRELRQVSAHISDLKNKYDVEAVEELESKLENGDIEEHPAWEDLIEWKNLRERKNQLQEY